MKANEQKREKQKMTRKKEERGGEETEVFLKTE